MVRIFWRSRSVRVMAGLTLGWVVLTGCQPTGRRALVEGDRLLQAGKPAEAVPLFERAASDLPADGSTWNLLGRSYHEIGRTTDAHKAYLKALKVDPNLFEAHYNLGQLYLETGAWRDAEADFRTWLNAVTNSSPIAVAAAWRGLGLAQFQQHNSGEAEKSFGMALRLDSNDAESWNVVGLIRQQRKLYRDAFNTFAYAARIAPKYAAPRLNAAIVAHQFLNDRRTALEYYRAYLALGPADSAAIGQVITQLEGGVGTTSVPTTPLTAPLSDAASTTPPQQSPVTHEPLVQGPNDAPGLTNAIGPRVHPPPGADSASVAKTTAAAEPNSKMKSIINSNPALETSPTPSVARDSSNPPRQPLPAPTLQTAPAVTSAKARLQSEEAPASIPPPTVSIPVAKVPVLEPAPLTVVRVEDRPRFLPARDPIPAPISTPIQPLPLVTATPSATDPPPFVSAAAVPPAPAQEPLVTSENGALVEPISGTGEPRKSSLWAKANPVNWFKRDLSAARLKRPTPLDLPPTREFAGLATSAGLREPQIPNPVPAVVTPPPVVQPVIERPPLAPPPKPVFLHYTRQITQAPNAGSRANAEIEFQRAVTAHRQQDFGPAVVGYQQAIAADPTYFEAHHNLALAALAKNELPIALRAAETATVLRPAEGGAHYQFAVALQRSRYPVEAVAELEAVARLQQSNAAAHYAAAVLYANDLQDPDQARAHYERVLALEPNHPQADLIRRWLQDGR